DGNLSGHNLFTVGLWLDETKQAPAGCLELYLAAQVANRLRLPLDHAGQMHLVAQPSRHNQRRQQQRSEAELHPPAAGPVNVHGAAPRPHCIVRESPIRACSAHAQNLPVPELSSTLTSTIWLGPRTRGCNSMGTHHRRAFGMIAVASATLLSGCY